MGWSPQINFQLRDDEVTFGKLIIDKNGAELLSEMLIDMKNDKPVNMETFVQILKEWCFSDLEFDDLRIEFDQIKADITEFKRLSASFGVQWTSNIQVVGAALDYAVGSKTWIEKYKENKQIAASLYADLKRKGHHFDPIHQQEYEKRYCEVISACTETELVETYLKRQYQQDVAAGVPDALEKYCAALVETGCLSKEAAEKKLQMARMWENAAADKKMQEVKEAQQAREEQRAEADAMKEAKKYMTLNLNLLQQLWGTINTIQDDPAAQDSCMTMLYDHMLGLYKCAGIMAGHPLANIDSQEKLWKYSQSLYNILTMSQNKGLVETAEYAIPAADVEKIMHYAVITPDETESSKQDTITLVEIQGWLSMITQSHSKRAAEVFIDILTDVAFKCDISIPTVPVYDIFSDCMNCVNAIAENADKLEKCNPTVDSSKVQDMMRYTRS